MGVFDPLAQLVEELAIPVDGDAIAQLLAVRDRLDAKLAEALVAFERAELWDTDAATSLTAWLKDRGGMSRRDALRTTVRIHRLATLPVTAAAWADGRLSGGQVEAVLAALDAATLARFAEHEHDVVPLLAGLSVDDTRQVMLRWTAFATADGLPPADPEPARALHVSTVGDRGFVDGSLDPDATEVLLAALRVAQRHDRDGDGEGARFRPAAERRADALVDICRFFLDHHHGAVGGRHRPHVNVVVDLADLEARRGGRVVDGLGLDHPTTERYLCDAALHRVVMEGRSAILDYGATSRTIPAPLWNALVVRDEHCRFPGCDRPASWCEAHHVRHWLHGGPTAIDNLVLLCHRHHHRLHQPGWHAKLRPDAHLEVTDPRGRVRTTAPPRAHPALC